MPFLLRFTSWESGIRPFDAQLESQQEWIDLPADFLFQFGSPISKGRLSVFLVDDPSNMTDIERIITAFVPARKNKMFRELGYVLLDQTDLERDGFTFDNETGDTPDPMVNAWHRNIVDVSIQRLLVLFRKAWFTDLREPLTPIQLKRIAREGQHNLDFASWSNREAKDIEKLFKKNLQKPD